MRHKRLTACVLAAGALSAWGSSEEAVVAQQPVLLTRLSSSATPRITSLDVVRQQTIEITSAALLADEQRSSVLQLDLFADVSFRAVRERIEPTANSLSWVGRLEGYEGSSALFVVVGDELVGHVYAPFGFFRVARQANGLYLAQQVDPEAARSNDVEIVPPTSRVLSTSAQLAASTDDGSVIDILVAYTKEALTKFRSTSQARADIELAVNETNEAFRNSGISTRIRLVHVVDIEYEEGGNSEVDLARLRNPNDGFLDSLHTLRDQHAADLVAIIVERSDVCGRAYLGALASWGSEYAFSLTRRVCMGSGITFAHEIGHNLGAMHDWYETDTTGAFPFSHGYVNVAGRFRDIMSLPDHCQDAKVDCPRLLFYANPVLKHQGHTQGTSVGTGITCKARNLDNPPCDADVAQTFARMAPFVAQYRDSSVRATARGFQ
jgi:peptidyl-Asp metalloendopeptidase